MRINKIITLIPMVLWLCVAMTVTAQDSLEVYISTAISHNPDVMQRYAQYQADVQKVPSARSLPDPELSAGIFLSPMEVMGGQQVASFKLMQMFPWFGTLTAAGQEMDAMARGSYEQYRDAVFQVRQDVQTTWYRLLSMKARIALAESNLEMLRAIEKLMLVQYQSPEGSGSSGGTTGMSSNSSSSSGDAGGGMSGMGGMSGGGNAPASASVSAFGMSSQSGVMGGSTGTSLADLYRLQIETGEQEISLEDLKKQLSTLTAQLNRYMNRPSDSELVLPDGIAPVDTTRTFSSLPDIILGNHPMLKMIEHEQQSLEARDRMVRRMGYPMLGVGVEYALINKSPMSTSAMNGNDMVMPMVTVTLPIYRKKYKAMQTENQWKVQALADARESTENGLQVQYHDALRQLADARNRALLYEHQVELVQKNATLVQSDFENGKANMTDWLRARQQVLDYGVKQYEALAEYHVGVARMERLMAINDPLK